MTNLIRKSLFLIFLSLTPELVLGQSNINVKVMLTDSIVSSQSNEVNIQYLELSQNKLLKSEIQKFISELSDTSQLFHNGFGYISVHSYKRYKNSPVLAQNLTNHLKDTVETFILSTSTILLSLNSSSELFCGDCFPAFYTTVSNRLVVFNDDYTPWITVNNYSIESKKLLVDLVRKSLRQALNPDFVFTKLDDHSQYKLSVEARKNLSEEQILEKTLFNKSISKKIILHFDNTISSEIN